MKTTLLPSICAVATVAFFSGCTTTSTQTASSEGQRPDVEITSEKRSYSQKELQKRGGPQLSDSLQAQDASVRIDGR